MLFFAPAGGSTFKAPKTNLVYGSTQGNELGCSTCFQSPTSLESSFHIEATHMAIPPANEKSRYKGTQLYHLYTSEEAQWPFDSTNCCLWLTWQRQTYDTKGQDPPPEDPHFRSLSLCKFGRFEKAITTTHTHSNIAWSLHF